MSKINKIGYNELTSIVKGACLLASGGGGPMNREWV